MIQKATNGIIECSPEQCSILAQTQQELVQAKARIAALERSEAIFRQTFEQTAVGIAQLSLDLKLLRFNQRYEEIMGYTPAELDQHGVADCIHPADMEEERQAARQLLAGEIATYRAQKRYLHKAGEVRWVNLTVSLVRTPDGQPDFLISAVEDITPLKQTEETLQPSGELYQRILEDQLDLVCRYNTAGDLIHVNQAYAAMTGKTPTELVGMNLFTFAPLSVQENIRAQMAALSAANPVARHEELITFPTGEERWIQWVDRAVRDPEGNVIEYQSVGRDITAQKQLQHEQQRYTHAIEETHQFLQSTLDAIAASIAVVDCDGTILNVNQYWKHFGLANGAQSPNGYYLGNYLAVCDAATGAQAAEAQPVAAGIRAVIAGSAEHFYLEYACHSLTEERWYGLRVTPFAEPIPRRVVVAHVNITERVQAELAERQQRHFAEALLDSLAALTGAMDVAQALQRILTATATVIPSEGGSIILFEDEWSRVAYLRGFSAEASAYYQANRFPLAQFQHGNDVRQGQPYFISDTQATADWLSIPGSEWIRSSIGVPIALQGRVIGLLCADSAKPYYFQPADVEKLQAFARYAGLALQNAQYLSQQETRVAERTAELQTAKEQVEAILNHSFDGILLVRPDLRIERSNAAFQQIFYGTTAADAPDEAFAGALSELIHLDDLARVQALIERVLATQVGEQIEIRCYQKHGAVFDAEMGIGLIKNNGIVCTVRDITKRKQVEQALRESEARLHKALSDAPFPIMLHAEDGAILHLNKQWTALTGYLPAELPTLTAWFERAYADPQPPFKHLLEEVYRQNKPRRNNAQCIRTQSGERRIWDFVMTPLGVMPDGRRLASTMAVDVTERKQMEEALRVQRDFLQLISDNVPVLISVKDCAGRFQLVNAATAHLHNLTPTEMIGKRNEEVNPNPAEVAFFQQMDQQTLTSGQTIVIPEQTILGRYYQTTKIPLKNAAGETDRLLSVSFDITERKAAEAAEREQRAFLQQVIDHIPAIITVRDGAGRYQLLNRQAAELYHVSPERMLGKTVADVYPDPNQVSAFNQEDQLVLASGCPSLLPEVTALGRYYEVNRIPIKNAAGQVDQVLIVSTDITARKQAEAAIRASEHKYRQLVETMQSGLVIYGIDGRATYVNDQLCRMIGYTDEELLGHFATEFVDAENAQIIRREFAKRKRRENAPYELTILHKDGRSLSMLASDSLLYNGQQEMIGVLSVLLDIGAQKQAEAALRASEQKYRHLVEVMRGGLVIIDAAQRVTYVNDRLCELLGYAPEEMVGRHPTDFVDTENVAVLQAQFAKRRQGESSSYELVMQHKQGRPVYLLASASPLRNEQQESIGTVAVLLDIETQKRAEAALRENLRKEQELGELKSRFISMASHEFRTPLASIQAITETLLAYRYKLADAQINQRLGKIQEQVGYLKSIMEDVLQLARLQARRAEFNPAPLDLDALCRSVIEEFQINPEQAKRLIYQGAPSQQVSLADKKLMRQILNNLIANGLKYSPADKPVTVKLTHEAKGLVLTVQDQGIGIPAADLAHLFEPFHRAANVGAIAGTGLGMVITKESVELHGGTITVQSQINMGTTVAVAIPYITPSATPTQAAELPSNGLNKETTIRH